MYRYIVENLIIICSNENSVYTTIKLRTTAFNTGKIEIHVTLILLYHRVYYFFFYLRELNFVIVT